MAAGTLQQALIKPETAIDHMPSATVKELKRRFAVQGQKLYWTDVNGHEQLKDLSLIRLFDEAGVFLGIYQLNKNKQLILPVKVFS